MARRRLRQARTLITGASSGIGRSLALALAEQQARLLLTARREDRLAELVAEITRRGGQATYLAGDMATAAVRQQLAAWIERHWQGLDILINNAGVGGVGPFATSDEARLRQIMELNFFAVTELTRGCLPLLHHGLSPVILNVGSVLGHFAVPKKSEYCASKFALHGWTDALRMELAADGIDVLLLSPSTTATEFFAQVKGDGGEVAVNRLAMTPQQVAKRAVRMLQRGEREVVLSWGGKMLVWLDRLLPGTLSRLLARWG
jgi:short-subunit dehydrogenase